MTYHHISSMTMTIRVLVATPGLEGEHCRGWNSPMSKCCAERHLQVKDNKASREDRGRARIDILGKIAYVGRAID